jgi:hypothetical protein
MESYRMSNKWQKETMNHAKIFILIPLIPCKALSQSPHFHRLKRWQQAFDSEKSLWSQQTILLIEHLDIKMVHIKANKHTSTSSMSS